MISNAPSHQDLADIASRALAEGSEEQALPLLERGAETAKTDARLWQWVGLLHRALDQHDRALEAFDKAARLAPDDASIAHGIARITQEAGLDARSLYARALKLAPSGDVLLGRAAALYAAGEGEAAIAELTAVLSANPLWVQGHQQIAQLFAMTGRPAMATSTIDAALAAHPGNLGLWQGAVQILATAERHSDVVAKADAAIAATGNMSAFALARAAALSDSGQVEPAGLSFASLGSPRDVGHAIHLARHLIRTRDWEKLSQLADRWMEGEGAHYFWPYASVCWRMTNDARWEWLEGDKRLVQVFDLTGDIQSLDGLATRLRDLHGRSGRFLDQSVRGGTQTDGSLFSRLDPEIIDLRQAVVRVVERYRANLPGMDARHPMLRHRRDGRVRFAGSWSVRLQGAGFHSHHIHPQGWISSAFYVAVPEKLEGEQGWLTLGEPQAELHTDLPPLRRIAARPGQLVLFPSMMWHGTLPFDAGERMTVAFDIAPPR